MKREVHMVGLSIAVMPIEGGFAPIDSDPKGIPFWGDVRWDAWFAALHSGFARELTVIGGVEWCGGDCIPKDCPTVVEGDRVGVGRAEAACYMLSKRGIDSSCLSALRSDGNTGGNAVALQGLVRSAKGEIVLVTNGYHLPRAMMDFQQLGIVVECVPAEAILLACSEDKAAVLNRLRVQYPGSVGARMIEEWQGCSDKLSGVYTSRSK